jgi:hypothetical protein
MVMYSKCKHILPLYLICFEYKTIIIEQNIFIIMKVGDVN